VPQGGLAPVCRNKTLHRTRAYLVSFESKAPIAAPFVDRCNRAAIAKERIGRHDLAYERDQAQHLKHRPEFCAIVGSDRGRYQAQAGD